VEDVHGSIIKEHQIFLPLKVITLVLGIESKNVCDCGDVAGNENETMLKIWFYETM
jgi:hypothetical protein